MIDQPRLFVTPVEALHLQIVHTLGAGWRVTLRARRAGDTWERVEERDYERLYTDELFDVVCADLAQLLGL